MPSRPRKNSSIASCGCMLLFGGVLSVLLWYFLGRPSTAEEALDTLRGIDLDDFSDILHNITLPDWLRGFNQDPFVGDNSTHAWATDGTGLSLELQNALDDAWTTEFETAVGDWGESDVLDLTTKDVEVDRECTPVDGVMKVCNANYGDTGWLGINEIQFQSRTKNGPSFITNSVAKMNEYYLLNADFNKRRYTMCHEIGHGFGLPHTDEIFTNKDLGNCLDYTNNPENNLLPGEVNFARLRSIYLKDGGSEPGRTMVRRRYLMADGSTKEETSIIETAETS